jgi:hypothetical protein
MARGPRLYLLELTNSERAALESLIPTRAHRPSPGPACPDRTRQIERFSSALQRRYLRRRGIDPGKEVSTIRSGHPRSSPRS